MNISKKLIGLVIIVLILAAGVAYFTHKQAGRGSLTMTVIGSATSSGADREYKAIVKIINNQVVDGSQSYHFGSGSPDASGNYPKSDYECVIKNGLWINKETGNDCDKTRLGNGYLENTWEGINNQINAGTLKKSPDCKRFDLCYEITY